jgi:hypothetical protein
MTTSTSAGILVSLNETGSSSTDRITANTNVRLSGLRPGGIYEYSTNAGETWTPVQAPLQSSSAVRFDGKDDYVAIPDNLSLPSGNNSYTIEAWIKPDSMGDRGIVGWGPWGAESSVNALRLMGNGSIRHYWWANDLDVNTGNLADGQWHHVAATFDGTTRSVYVDGVLKGSDTPKRHRVPPKATNVRIGSTNNSEYFNGSIDDVAIWNRALSASEITNRLSTPPNPTDRDLAVYYSFSEANGSSVAASGASGSALTGTFVNGATWTTRDISASNSLGTTTLALPLSQGNYMDGQLLVREQGAQEQLVVPAFSIDTSAPTVTLDQPGGADAIVSSKAGDNVITGKAEPGQNVSLSSRIGTVKSGNLRITSDNAADIYLNGKFVASTNDWTKPYDFTGLDIQSGTNVLAILAYDVGGIAGLSGRFNVPTGAFGTSNTSGWKVLNVDPESLTDNSAASRDKSLWKLPANWAAPSFDDTAWSSPVDVRAKTGQYPWGNITGDPTWIWSADPYNHDAVLFRYTFTGTADEESLQPVVSNIKVADDGTFTYALTPAQIQLLGQGQGKSLVATQQDLAGNRGRSAELPFSIDTEIGAVKITSVGGGDGKVSSDPVEVGQGPLKFQLDQYTGYWSSRLSDLQAYVNNYNALTSKNRFSVLTDAIDYTDDAGGFAGELSFDRRWPAAEAANYWGKGGVNDRFFVKISADFYVSDTSKYRFRTYNDDGVFLLVDNKLVINDPTLHPERVFTGDIDLQPGNHQLELYFFENGGEASLEFSASRFDPVKNSWGPYQLVGQDSSIKSKSELKPDNIVTGEADPNSIVNLSIAGQELGSALADAGGKFTLTLSDQALERIASGSGASALVATVTDLAGNVSTSAPAAIAVSDPVPEVQITSIGGADSQITTKNSDHFLIGAGTPGLSTSIYLDNTKLGDVLADAQGVFRFEFTSERLAQVGQGAGKQVWAEQTTASGVKGRSTNLPFSVDTVAPRVIIDRAGLDNSRVSRTNNVIEGRAEPGGPVSLYLGDVLLGSSPTTPQGAFVHPLSANALSLIAANPQPGLRVVQTDSAGNQGESSQIPLRAKLTAPVFSQLSIGGGDGVVSSRDGDARISGTAEPGFPVTLLFNGQPLQTSVTANAFGQFSASLISADLAMIGEGPSRILTLQQTDDYGNVGEATTATFAVDTLAPQIVLPSRGDRAALGGVDGVISTQVNDSLITGRSEPGLLLVKYGINTLAELQVGADGQFSYRLSSQNLAGIGQGSDKLIQLEQLDAAGNLGLSQINVSVDTVPPPSPSISTVATDAVVSGVSNDNLILGTAEPGAAVSLLVNGREIAVAKASVDGNYSYRLSPADLLSIGEGEASLVAELSDPAGNRARSDVFLFRVDTVAPATPLVQSVGGDDAVVSTRGSTAVTQTVDNLVTGRAEANASVRILAGNRVLGETQALDDGRFTYALTAPNVAALGQGVDKKLQVVAVDSAGNASTASQTINFSIDTLAPNAPRLSSIGGSDGVISSQSGDNVISGTAEPLSLIELRAFADGVDTASSSASALFTIQLSADRSGKWSYAFTNVQLAGLEAAGSTLVSAVSTDAAGNESRSVPFNIRIDRQAPLLGLAQTGGVDNTVSSKIGDAVIRGTAEANRLLTLSFQGRKIADVRAGLDGTFSYALRSSDLRTIGEGGNKQLQISQTDGAGNTSQLLSQPFAVDITAPGKARISSLGGTDKIVSTAESDRVVRGVGEAGTTVELLAVAGATRTVLGSQTIAADGTFAYTLTPDNLRLIGKGLGKSLVAASSDAAGNVSTSDSFSYQVKHLWLTGTEAADKLAFASGMDALAGQSGADTFIIRSLGTVVMDTGLTPDFDRITDLQIGVDRIDAPTAVPAGQVRDLGVIQGLVGSAIGNLLSSSSFPADTAAVFTYDDREFGQRTFLALNDGIAGFRPQSDGILEITGYSGNLSALALI